MAVYGGYKASQYLKAPAGQRTVLKGKKVIGKLFSKHAKPISINAKNLSEMTMDELSKLDLY